MQIKMHELRATGESLLRAAGSAKSEATREFYVKRARLLESLTKDVAWLDPDRTAEWRAKEDFERTGRRYATRAAVELSCGLIYTLERRANRLARLRPRDGRVSHTEKREPQLWVLSARSSQAQPDSSPRVHLHNERGRCFQLRGPHFSYLTQHLQTPFTEKDPASEGSAAKRGPT